MTQRKTPSNPRNGRALVMNIKTIASLASASLLGVGLLTACGSTASTPTPAPTSATPIALAPALPDGAQAGTPSREFLLSSLTQDLDKVWAQDDTANKQVCNIWTKDKSTVLDSLMAAKSGAADPVGVTDGDVKAHLSDYFDTHCATL